jgi:hypothetical protein
MPNVAVIIPGMAITKRLNAISAKHAGRSDCGRCGLLAVEQ